MSSGWVPGERLPRLPDGDGSDPPSLGVVNGDVLGPGDALTLDRKADRCGRGYGDLSYCSRSDGDNPN